MSVGSIVSQKIRFRSYSGFRENYLPSPTELSLSYTMVIAKDMKQFSNQLNMVIFDEMNRKPLKFKENLEEFLGRIRKNLEIPGKKKHDLGNEVYRRVTRKMKSLKTPNDLFEFFSMLRSIVEEKRSDLSTSSNAQIEAYLRKLCVEFERLSFDQVSTFYGNVRRYVEGEALEISMHQMERCLFHIIQTVEHDITNDRRTILYMPDIIKKMFTFKKSFPSYYKVSYFKFLLAVQRKDVGSAEKHLHKYFDLCYAKLLQHRRRDFDDSSIEEFMQPYNVPERDDLRKKMITSFASLHLASLYCYFYRFEDAKQALLNTIKLSQSNMEEECLALASSWLYRLMNEQVFLNTSRTPISKEKTFGVEAFDDEDEEFIDEGKWRLNAKKETKKSTSNLQELVEKCIRRCRVLGVHELLIQSLLFSTQLILTRLPPQRTPKIHDFEMMHTRKGNNFLSQESLFFGFEAEWSLGQQYDRCLDDKNKAQSMRDRYRHIATPYPSPDPVLRNLYHHLYLNSSTLWDHFGNKSLSKMYRESAKKIFDPPTHPLHQLSLAKEAYEIFEETGNAVEALKMIGEMEGGSEKMKLKGVVEKTNTLLDTNHGEISEHWFSESIIWITVRKILFLVSLRRCEQEKAKFVLDKMKEDIIFGYRSVVKDEKNRRSKINYGFDFGQTFRVSISQLEDFFEVTYCDILYEMKYGSILDVFKIARYGIQFCDTFGLEIPLMFYYYYASRLFVYQQQQKKKMEIIVIIIII